MIIAIPITITAKNLEREREDPRQKEMTALIEKLQKEEREKAKEKRQQTRLRKSTFVIRNNPNFQLSRPPPTNLEDLERSLELKEKNRYHLKHKKNEDDDNNNNNNNSSSSSTKEEDKKSDTLSLKSSGEGVAVEQGLSEQFDLNLGKYDILSEYGYLYVYIT